MPVALPPSLTGRPATPEDVDSITRLVSACELHDDGMIEVDRDDVASDFELVGFDAAKDSLLVHDGDELVGWIGLYVRQGTMQGDVHPVARGRGIGTALLEWAEARAGEAAVAEVGQTKTDANLEAADLFRTRGYAPRWTSWLLEIALAGALDEPTLPPGIAIRPFERGVDDRVVYRLIDDAFSEWEGRESMPFEDWAAFAIERPTFDPRLSPLAVEGDEVVGAVLCLDYGHPDEGFVHQVAVRPSHRNRGIARALLLHAFGEFRALGRRTCTLSTDSRTGALALYERVGMRVRRSYTRFSKRLT